MTMTVKTGGASLSGLSTEVLEAEICGLAARVAVATCRFLLAVAEYDRRGGWEAWECKDMAAWLSWKCGISPVTAREQVRVARSLEVLPRLREAFEAGRLSYSQVRAISRVATPDSEGSLVDLAQGSTAAQLERIVRAYRRCRRATQESEQRRHAGRFFRFGWNDDGSLTGSFSVPAEAGAVLMKALDARLDRRAIDEAEADGAKDPLGAARADLLVEILAIAAGQLGDSDGANSDDDDSRFLLTIVAEETALTADADSNGEEGSLCQVTDGPGLASETALRIGCDAAVVRIVEGPDGQVLDLGRRTRRPNRALRRAVRHRDGHCRYPGCTRRRFQTHHVRHWIQGGPTKLTNLVALCPFHHRRVHEGGYRLTMDPNGKVSVFHPNGYLIPEVPDPPTLLDDDHDSQDIDAYTSGWDGSRLDLPHIMDCLLQDDGLLVPQTAEPVSAESQNDTT